jgi:hypothetical protein
VFVLGFGSTVNDTLVALTALMWIQEAVVVAFQLHEVPTDRLRLRPPAGTEKLVGVKV